MSRYSGTTPTSHIPAYPPHHNQPNSYGYRVPNNAGPSSQPWNRYGPPPPVPQSLYQDTASSLANLHQTAVEMDVEKRRIRGMDYLRSLGSDLASMTLYDAVKPEANRTRPVSELSRPTHDLPMPPEMHYRAHSDLPSHPSRKDDRREDDSPKSFRPSPYLILPTLHRPDSSTSRLDQHSNKPLIQNRDTVSNSIPSTPPRRSKIQQSAVIDLAYSPASSSSAPSTPTAHVTPRSPARIRRVSPSRPINHTPTMKNVTTRPSPKPRDTESAIQCAGYTRSGHPCKRLVKASAPLLSSWNLNIDTQSSSNIVHGGPRDKDEDEVVGRYCKDHAGMICSAEGFYSRYKAGTWIAFNDWVPPEFGQQTQTLLRMTMESKLTAKELPGFIYAYELRDMQTARTSYYKVGRTDNVPRRIGQWTNRGSSSRYASRSGKHTKGPECTSKTPTLRDIFPLAPAHTYQNTNLNRQASLNKSMLPGAIAIGTVSNTNRRPCVAMKRWERLIHLELADLASRERAEEWASDEVKGKCNDCGVVHKEIFPVPRDEAEDGLSVKEGSYQIVVEIISRWARFVEYAYDADQSV